MGLTFQQKFYNIGEEVFLVHSKAHGGNCKTIALVEVSDDENENETIEFILRQYGFVERVNFDEVILKGYDLLRK